MTYRKRWKSFTFWPLLLPIKIQFLGSTVYPLSFSTIGSQLIFLISRLLAKCCNGSHWVKDSAGWLLGFYGAAWSQWAELPPPGEYGWYHHTRRRSESTQAKGIRRTCTKMCVERAWPRLHIQTLRGPSMIKHVPVQVQGAAKHIAPTIALQGYHN